MKWIFTYTYNIMYAQYCDFYCDSLYYMPEPNSRVLITSRQYSITMKIQKDICLRE